MMILKELGETLAEAGLWLAGGWRACESGESGWGSERVWRRGEGWGRARRSWHMLTQEYTVVKGKLAMKIKGLGEGGVRTGLSGERDGVGRSGESTAQWGVGRRRHKACYHKSTQQSRIIF
jgi:hypothetical protein